MIDPAMDDDRELTAEEMAAIEDFTDRFCQGLSDLVRQAAPSANKILRQRIDFKDYTDSVHLASKFFIHNIEFLKLKFRHGHFTYKRVRARARERLLNTTLP